MEVICTHGAGLDVHQRRLTACRVTPDATGPPADGLLERQDFGTMTADLLALSDWLAKLRRDELLQASFIPPAAPRDLRALTWDRTKLV
jgi:hypothetical protein